jgi:hypothetical protein
MPTTSSASNCQDWTQRNIISSNPTFRQDHSLTSVIYNKHFTTLLPILIWFVLTFPPPPPNNPCLHLHAFSSGFVCIFQIYFDLRNEVMGVWINYVRRSFIKLPT